MITLPHLETNITTACTNSCVGCNHFIPLQEKSFIDPKVLARDLKKLSRFVRADRYALLGGEPLLHPKLMEIIKIARSSGISNVIEIETNGALLQQMPIDFWNEIDYLRLTVYPGKMTEERLDWIEEKCHKHGLEIEVKKVCDDRFVAPLRKIALTDPEQIKQVYRKCWYKTYCYTVDNGYFYRCCTTPFIPKLLLDLPEGTDGIALESMTEDKLRLYLYTDKPPLSCSVCIGHAGLRLDWVEERDPRKWLEKSSV